MMIDSLDRSFSFTPRAEHNMMETVDDMSFSSHDAGMIFQALQSRLDYIPFCDYLKRYIYIKSGMIGPFRSVPLSDYQEIMIAAFRDSGTPCSLHRKASHLATRIRDWLTQESVHREAMLLIAFGLSMTTEDVDRFLKNACHDHQLDPEDPLEAICAYCYDHGYGFAKMEQLMRVYDQIRQEKEIRPAIQALHPAMRSESMNVLREDTLLMQRLWSRKDSAAPTEMDQRTAEHFHRLYGQAREVIQRNRPGEYASPEQVHPGDMENILCVSIPRTGQGNLISHLSTSLRKELSCHRISRQRLYRLLAGDVAPSRYDLITLRFLICAESIDSLSDPHQRYLLFLEDINRILLDCGYGSLYLADPYECMILMCVLSTDPLGTYSDVWEIAYSGATGGDYPE